MMICKQAPAHRVPNLLMGAEEYAVEGLVSGVVRREVSSRTQMDASSTGLVVGFAWGW